MLLSAFVTGAWAATLNLQLHVEGCDELVMSVPDVDSGTSLEVPLPGCENRLLTASLQRVTAVDGDEPLWQVDFQLIGSVRVHRNDELRVLMQPTMIARPNQGASFTAGSAVATTAVTVRRASGDAESIPLTVPPVALSWSISDE
ncbi:MAG: hypothetical protein H6738_11865 [Alphaproteobacteria bacterium]|nr:hypothetical protein [Alphaproteobacteria bacterium]MCB9697468.1 hypothetical protein [Alphaproteobacteria bacterium]